MGEQFGFREPRAELFRGREPPVTVKMYTYMYAVFLEPAVHTVHCLALLPGTHSSVL